MPESSIPLEVKRSVPRASMSPYAPPVLTGDETVDEVIENHPCLRLALMSYGLCTCCSGNLTLRATAAARGIPLAVILGDLERELAKGV